MSPRQSNDNSGFFQKLSSPGLKETARKARQSYQWAEEKYGRDRLVGAGAGALKGFAAGRFLGPAGMVAGTIGGAAAGFVLARPINETWESARKMLDDWLEVAPESAANENGNIIDVEWEEIKPPAALPGTEANEPR